MDTPRICIERPVNNRRFYAGFAVSACVTIAWFWLAASTEGLWMAYPLTAFHLIGLVATAFRPPSAKVVIEPDAISWFGDGLFWPTSNLVSFIEITEVELRNAGDSQFVLLHSRYSDPWVIHDNCFTDATAILSAIRELRPSLPVSDRRTP